MCFLLSDKSQHIGFRHTTNGWNYQDSLLKWQIQIHCLQWKSLNLDENFTEIYSRGSHWQLFQVIVVHQAITWNNVEQDLYFKASLGLDGLMGHMRHDDMPKKSMQVTVTGSGKYFVNEQSPFIHCQKIPDQEKASIKISLETKQNKKKTYNNCVDCSEKWPGDDYKSAFSFKVTTINYQDNLL